MDDRSNDINFINCSKRFSGDDAEVSPKFNINYLRIAHWKLYRSKSPRSDG